MSAELETFLERVCAWPESDEDPGYNNLHWIDKGKAKSFGAPGKPFRNIGDFLWMAKYLLAQNGKLDLYFCTTRQRSMKMSAKNKPLAVRKAENAICSKALWIDIDVKPDKPDTAYVTLAEAYRALLVFCQNAGLPDPNVIVESGGGIHAYWAFDKPVPIAEWQWLANALVNAIRQHGLKCDSGCTTDAARILRLPGTWNHKTDPPKRTNLRHNDPVDFSYGQLLQSLQPFSAAPSHSIPDGDAVRLPILPSMPTSAFAAGHPAAARVGATISVAPALGWDKPNLPPGFSMEGFGSVEPSDFAPIDIRRIIPQCAFLKEAIDTGGKAFDQTQWRYTTLMATAMEKGYALAHGMANGHPEYTRASTDEMWTRCQGDVLSNPKLAWVSCRSIERSGHAGNFTGCANCPLLAHGKTPLHIALQVQPPANTPAPGSGVAPMAGLAHPTAGVVTSPPDLMLPDKYVINQNGNICMMVNFARKGEDPDEHPVEMFLRPLSDPWVQDNPRGLRFLTEWGQGTATREVFLEGAEMMAQTKFKDMVAKFVTPNLPFAREHMENFYMGWLSKIEKMKGHVRAVTFGWMPDNGLPNNSFVFGGRQWKGDGSDAPAGYVETAFREVYEPTGSRDPWIKAAQQFVFDQHRADLECLLATAFAAPLMIFSGQPGGLVAVHGLSAAGKSTTTAIACAVWSHPKKTRETLSSTTNSVVHKMGKLGNLPVYWDEIATDHEQKQLLAVAQYINQGVEKGRMLDGHRLQERNSWATLLVSTSNLVLYDHIAKVQKTTEAGANRVFEYKVEKRPMHMAHIDIDMLNLELLHNYGVIGLEYAQHLAKVGGVALKERCTAANKRITGKVTDRAEERVWTAISATLLLGAELANEMGVTTFDLDMLLDFLCSTILHLREKVKAEAFEATTTTNIEENLTNFLRDHIDQTIMTDRVPFSAADSKMKMNLLRAPPHDKRKIVVQFVRDTNRLRISFGAFKDWLDARGNHGRSSVMEGFVTEYGMEILPKAKLGACTDFRQGQERIMELKIKPYSWLWLMIPGNVSPDGAEEEEPKIDPNRGTTYSSAAPEEVIINQQQFAQLAKTGELGA